MRNSAVPEGNGALLHLLLLLKQLLTRFVEVGAMTEMVSSIRQSMQTHSHSLYAPSLVDGEVLKRGMAHSLEAMTTHFHAFESFLSAFRLMENGHAPPPIITSAPLVQWPSGPYVFPAAPRDPPGMEGYWNPYARPTGPINEDIDMSSALPDDPPVASSSGSAARVIHPPAGGKGKEDEKVSDDPKVAKSV